MNRFYFILSLLIALPYTAQAQLFQDYAEIVGINHYTQDSLRISAGVVVFDYDNDGWDDFYLNGVERPHELYRNVGDFEFEKTTTSSGLADIEKHIYAAGTADLNNDGWEDLLLLTGEGEPSILLRNNGDGTFTNITAGSGLEHALYWGMAVSFADFNDDGLLDIYIGNYAKNPTVPLLGSNVKGAYPNELYLSNGEPFNYTEVAEEKGIAGSGFTLSVLAADYDLDGDTDIYVANDFGVSGNEINRYYENNGEGNFQERSEELGLDLGIFGMGIGMADLQADGDFDLYISDLVQNHFLQKEADGTYTNIISNTFATGAYVSWGAAFFDANHDAHLDLFMSNGQVIGEDDQPNLYYENLGNDTFLATQYPQIDPPFYARGWAYSDLDNDGDLDIITTQVAESAVAQTPTLKVYRNIADLRKPSNGFLQVKLPTRNAMITGSLLKLHLDNGTTLMQMVNNGGTFASKHTSILHFGLGTAQIDSLEIFWQEGDRDVFASISPNTLVAIDKDSGLQLIRGDVVLGTSNNFEQEEAVHLFQEYAAKSLHLKSSKTLKQVQLILTDLAGQEVWRTHQMNLVKGERTFDLPVLSGSIYIVTLMHSEGAIRKKIIMDAL